MDATDLRTIAATITGDDLLARNDRGYLLDTADAIDAGTASLEDRADAAAIAADYSL